MNLELIENLKQTENGLVKLSKDRKVVLPHHKPFEVVEPRSSCGRGTRALASPRRGSPPLVPRPACTVVTPTGRPP